MQLATPPPEGNRMSTPTWRLLFLPLASSKKKRQVTHDIMLTVFKKKFDTFLENPTQQNYLRAALQTGT